MYGVFHLLLAIRDKHGRLALLEYAVSAAVVDNISSDAAASNTRAPMSDVPQCTHSSRAARVKANVCGAQGFLSAPSSSSRSNTDAKGDTAGLRSTEPDDTVTRSSGGTMSGSKPCSPSSEILDCELCESDQSAKGMCTQSRSRPFDLYCHDLHGINVVRRLWRPIGQDLCWYIPQRHPPGGRGHRGAFGGKVWRAVIWACS